MTKTILGPILTTIAFILLVMSVIFSCKHDSMITQVPEINFEKQVLPIFQLHCAIPGCHDGVSGDRRLNLSDYSNIVKDVVPGKPYSSRIYTALIDVYGNIMPPQGPLQEKDRTLIKLWIEQGAKDTKDTSGSSCDTSNITIAGAIGVILGDHCYGCHSNANASTYGAGIKLQDSADIVIRAARISGAVQHKQGFYAMPLGTSQLDSCKKTKISVWARRLSSNISTTCDTNNVTFSGTIAKLLNDYCLACHSNANAPTLGANIRLQDYADVIAKSGRLLGALEQLPGYFAMPLGQSKLDTCKIQQFAIWVRKVTDSIKPGDTSHYAKRACFQRDILPVLVSSCAMSGCHNNTTAQGGYIFTNYATVRQAVQPFNPNESALYASITGGEDKMPPPGYTQLTQTQIDSIRNWILYGALDEQCFSSSCDTTNVTFSGTVWPIINSYCKGCHSTANASGGYNLDNYNNISSYAKSGILMNALNGNGVPIMPLGTTLLKCKIDQVDKWVRNGALKN
jgi:hypothetical protein